MIGLIGTNSNGIGFGNISIRIDDTRQFIITGSNTGGLDETKGKHFTRVVNFDIAGNSLICRGPIQASSESLTHAAIYTANDRIKGVIHVHSKYLWQRLKDVAPTTSVNVEYGTPEIASEMARLLIAGESVKAGIIVMGGHREGLVAFGRTLTEAGEIILDETRNNPD